MGRESFSAVVDGLAGYVGGPAGWIVGPLCSWAFDAQWERCSRVMNKKAPGVEETANTGQFVQSPTYVFKGDRLEKLDSIGFYHNRILDDIILSEKCYFLSNGNINYDDLFNDCMKYANKYGVDISVSSTDRVKLLSLAQDIVESFLICVMNDEPIEIAFKRVNLSYVQNFNDVKRIENVELVQHKIMEVLAEINDENEIVDYADKIYKVIEDAEINSYMSRDLKTMTSVTVNSKLYWENSSKSE